MKMVDFASSLFTLHHLHGFPYSSFVDAILLQSVHSAYYITSYRMHKNSYLS